MTRENTWLNEDGLIVPFGTSDGIQAEAGTLHTLGSDKELVIDLDFTNLPVTGTAIEGNNFSIPADAVILSAELEATSTWSGAVEIGTMDVAGVVVDADGLLVSAVYTDDTFTVGAGAQVGTVIAEDLYIAVTGTVTTGSGSLVVKYRI